MFDNIPENENEDCTKMTKQAIMQKLKIDTDDAAKIRIVRCHWLGQKKPGCLNNLSASVSVVTENQSGEMHFCLSSLKQEN